MTLEEFTQIFPECSNPEDWFEHFSILQQFGIDSSSQIAHFCAQIGHESHDMKFNQENLNYSADRLKVVFPKYFKNVDPALYHRNPSKIASRVYADRMGNGPETTGDGYRYRGRGCLQLTGKSNYAACSDYLFSDENILLDNPDLLFQDNKTNLLSALWFWQKNGLADIDDPTAVSKRVNGGTNGLEDRLMRYDRACLVLMQS